MREEERSWRPAEPIAERVVPPAASYRKQQHDAEAKAQTARSDVEREAWRKIADGWRQLAEPAGR